MRRPISGFLVVLSLLVGASAFAANERRHKPSEYQEISDEDRAAARERARSRVSTWRETDLPPEYKFPWLQVGFVALTLAIAVPFAWAAYNRHSKELREIGSATTPVARKRSSKPAAPVQEE